MEDKQNILNDITPEQLKAAKKGDVRSLLKGLDKKSLETLSGILKDEQRTKEILSSPEAQALFNAVMKKDGRKNG